MEDSLINSSMQERPFSRWFYRSILLHACIITVILLSSTVFKKIIDQKKKSNIRLVESSVRVDVVAMPSMTIKELKAVGAVPLNKGKPIEAPKEVKTPDLNNSKTEFLKQKKQKNFMDLLKNMAKKKIPKSKTKSAKVKKGSRKGKADGINNRDLKQLILAGNKLSEGSALTGNSGAAADDFTRYISSLPDFVRPKWKLPSYMMDQGLKCRIRVFLNPTGRILRAEIYESSGNSEYDSRALEAVKVSSPFPELAESFKSRGINGDIVLGFPL